jgi:hypothetical protein
VKPFTIVHHGAGDNSPFLAAGYVLQAAEPSMGSQERGGTPGTYGSTFGD